MPTILVFWHGYGTGDRLSRTIRQTTVIPKHQDPEDEPHSNMNEGEFIVPVSVAPSAFVDATEYVVQLETPQDSPDPAEANVPTEGDVEATESPQTLRKAA